MPKAAPLQGNFSAGEIGPLVYGRVDAERYKHALATCLNYIPTLEGALTRRGGTEQLTYGEDGVLIPFEFSRDQAYVLHFFNGNFRVLKQDGSYVFNSATKSITAITQANPGVVTTSASHGYSNGDIVYVTGIVGMTELNNKFYYVSVATATTFRLVDFDDGATQIDTSAMTAYSSGGTLQVVLRISDALLNYTASDLDEIHFIQSNDVVYLFHKDYEPLLITRLSETNWTVQKFPGGPKGGSGADEGAGPYVTGDSQTSMTPSATSGAITITASSDTFVATDEGRRMAILHGSTWGFAEITNYVSATVVDAATFTGFAFGATTASTNWKWTIWGETNGYPATGVFHEDRLCTAGVPAYPSRVDMSASGDYYNFEPNGTADGDSLSITLNSRTSDPIKWLATDEKGLLAGTGGNDWIIRPASNQAPLSITNVAANKSTGWGSSDQQAIQIGKSVIYLQSSTKKMRELSFAYEVEGFRSDDISLLASHLPKTGYAGLAHQREPQSIIWTRRRSDGALIGVTYDKTIDTLQVGWHRHELGGVSDTAGSIPVVESIAVIPSEDGQRDELWLLVKRYINGTTRRHIERMTKIFEEEDVLRDAKHLDCMRTYDSPLTITAITKANPAVVTSVGHGLSNGDSVLLSDIVGMTELNDIRVEIANVAANTFELVGIDSSAYTTYVSGGEARKLVTVISGLSHLEGETVSVVTDGATHADVTVASGEITLDWSAGTVHVGYDFNSDGKTLRLDAGSANGTAIGKTRRTNRVGFMLNRTVGLKFGTSFDTLDEIPFRVPANSIQRAVPLFSGILSETHDANYDFENQICFRQNKGLPGTIQAILPQLEEQDR